MARKDFNVYDSAGNLRNWFLHPTEFKAALGISQNFKEGDFVFNTDESLDNVRRFDTIPFGVSAAGASMTFRFNFNDSSLYQSPRLVCLGSSTLANTGLGSPLGYGNRIETRLNAETTSPTFYNFALGGQTSDDLMPLSEGGTPGRSIDDAIALNPSFILIDEPTNWAGSWDAETQGEKLAYLWEYAFQRGYIVIFNGPRPRTQMNSTQKQRLADFAELIETDPLLKFVVNNNYKQFLKSGTVGDIKDEYAQSDGIHLNAAGTLLLEQTSWAFWQNFFRSHSPYNRIDIERSTNGGVTYSNFDQITDLSLLNKTYERQSGIYRAKARLRDSSFTSNTNTVTVTVPTSNPPLVNAGANVSQALHANENSVTLTGSATPDSGRTIVSYQWTQVSGPAIAGMTAPNSATNKVYNLAVGVYEFKLSVTDDLGANGEDSVEVSITVGSTDKRVLIDFGGDGTNGSKTPASLNGSGTLIGPDASGKYWNNVVTISGAGTWSSSLVDTVGNTVPGMQITGNKRPGGTFGSGNSMNFAGASQAVGEYPVTACQDNLFVHSSASIVEMTVTPPTGYRIKSLLVWGNRTDNVDTNRTLQMRVKGDTEWKQFNSANNLNNGSGIVFNSLTGTVTFEMQVLPGRTFGHIGVMDFVFEIDDTPIPPLVNAGTDQAISLPTDSVVLTGSASAFGGATIVSYEWTQVSGPSTATLSGESTNTLTASDLVEGTYVFRLTVTDSNDEEGYDEVTVTVAPEPLSSNFRVLLDVGYTSTSLSSSGAPLNYSTASPDGSGNYWNNFDGYGGEGVGSGLSDGCETGTLVDTDNGSTGIKLKVVRNIYGTFSSANGTRGLNPDGLNSAVGDYPATAVRDSAFAHSSKTDGLWRLTGLNPALTYLVKFWGNRNEASTTNRYIQIKMASESTWQEYNASRNTDFNNCAEFTFTGVTEMDFDIRVKSGSTFGYIGVVDIYAYEA